MKEYLSSAKFNPEFITMLRFAPIVMNSYFVIRCYIDELIVYYITKNSYDKGIPTGQNYPPFDL